MSKFVTLSMILSMNNSAVLSMRRSVRSNT